MLRKQAMRSIWRNKRSYSACLLLLAVGVAVFVAFQQLLYNLDKAVDGMYLTQRFGDAFATVALMPQSVAQRAESIDGVARADATLVADARVRRTDSNRIITLRLISYDPGDGERLNNFLLTAGAMPGEGGVLVSEAFATAGGIAIGDTVSLVVAGQSTEPVVTGLAQSPEYVYAIPDAGQLLPDDETFGVGYMPAEQMGTLLGRTGFATNLSLKLEEGTTFRLMESQLRDLLAPYGLISLTERADQVSHAMLDQELESVSGMATSFPALFITIAVVILYIVLKRLIEQERTQIGVLKAMGYSSVALLAHYMGYGAVIGLAGGVLGGGLGLWLNSLITPIFMEFFSLPALTGAPAPAYIVGGVLLSLAAGLVGAGMGARAVLQLSPSEAMRPPSPPAVKGDLLGRLPALGVLLTSYGFMSLRNIARNRFRSSFVVLGIAVSYALTAFMASYGDMFDAIMLNQFTQVERYSLKVALDAPATRTAALEAGWSLPGVRQAETVLELPVELYNAHLSKAAQITAIEADSSLYRIYDNATGEALPPPDGGVILSDSLARNLRVERGDVLTMSTPYTGDRRTPLPVLDVIESNLGSTAFIRIDSLWDLLGIGSTATGLLLDASEPDEIKEILWDAGNIAAITDQAEALQIYTSMLDSYAVMINMLQLAGMVIAFAIIANTATISLSERQREYATMRVLGMLPGEIGQVIGLEYWALSLLALPPGILFTRLFKQAMAGMIDNELFTMPVRTSLASYVSAAVLCGMAVLLSNRLARRKIARFDMVAVLKERE